MALHVIERKSEKTGTAEQQPNGKYMVKIDGGAKELAESTFKRLYTITGEEEIKEVEQAEQAEQVHEELKDVAPSEELNELLGDAEAVQEEVENKEMVEAPLVLEPEDKQGEEEKEDEPSALEKLGLQIELEDWDKVETRGGKTEKVMSVIMFNDHKMHITEYNGYITDVRLFEEDENAPENDPDAQWKQVYRSPKYSLKDTLEFLGLADDDMRTARKEITAIRKAVRRMREEEQEEQETEMV